MWEIVWLRSLGVAAGFFRSAHWGLICLQARRKTSVMPPDADVGRAAFNSSCATGQVIQSPTCCDVISSCARGLLHLRAACVVNRLIGPNRFIASGVHIEGEAGNPPLSSTISNSYRPEAWGLNGGGVKRLNEQSERYLQLPPLTWAATVVIGRHPYAGTSLSLYFSVFLPAHCFLCREKLESGKREKGENCFLWHFTCNTRKKGEMESTRKHGCLGKRWKKMEEWSKCTAH